MLQLKLFAKPNVASPTKGVKQRTKCNCKLSTSFQEESTVEGEGEKIAEEISMTNDNVSCISLFHRFNSWQNGARGFHFVRQVFRKTCTV